VGQTTVHRACERSVSEAENGAERAETRLERSGERGSKKSSGAWAEREREIVGTGTERWAGKVCRSKFAPP